MVRWQLRHTRHQRIYLGHMDEVGDGFDTLSSERASQHDAGPPIGSWVRSRHCWVVVRGAVEGTRQDGFRQRLEVGQGVFRAHIAGTLEMRALEPGSLAACINPRDPEIWWDREVIELPAGASYLIPDIGQHQTFIVISGDVRLESSPRRLYALDVAEFAPNTGGSNLLAEESAIVLRLVNAGRYVYTPPEGSVRA